MSFRESIYELCQIVSHIYQECARISVVVSRVFRTFVRRTLRVSASNPKILGAKEKSVQVPWPPPPKAAWFDGFRNG